MLLKRPPKKEYNKNVLPRLIDRVVEMTRKEDREGLLLLDEYFLRMMKTNGIINVELVKEDVSVTVPDDYQEKIKTSLENLSEEWD